jgi:hypothetical protein
MGPVPNRICGDFCPIVQECAARLGELVAQDLCNEQTTRDTAQQIRELQANCSGPEVIGETALALPSLRRLLKLPQVRIAYACTSAASDTLQTPGTSVR